MSRRFQYFTSSDIYREKVLRMYDDTDDDTDDCGC